VRKIYKTIYDLEVGKLYFFKEHLIQSESTVIPFVFLSLEGSNNLIKSLSLNIKTTKGTIIYRGDQADIYELKI
jgi:hypothetical protein